jgi:hypothetical protein
MVLAALVTPALADEYAEGATAKESLEQNQIHKNFAISDEFSASPCGKTFDGFSSTSSKPMSESGG